MEISSLVAAHGNRDQSVTVLEAKAAARGVSLGYGSEAVLGGTISFRPLKSLPVCILL